MVLSPELRELVSASISSAPTMLQNSSSLCHSRLVRANRDASNGEYGANLPIAARAQQAFKAGAGSSVPRDSEIIIDDIDVLVLPTQCPRMLD
jgi:hypothetical protein